ncbi:hypothetical protein OIU85_028297 [Salix viminalis]|uniref:Uncharacterized protein n=1 Tax=Salix viminalis TaxID=40686 RepID=A0A9Q0QKK3_SALVM|nr:hypothetical protein OIU85_028297 [Salix viminalis]
MEGRSTCIGRRIRKNSDQQTLHTRPSTPPHPSHHHRHQTRRTTSPAWIVGPTAKKLNLSSPQSPVRHEMKVFTSRVRSRKRSDPDPVRHWDLHSPLEVKPCGRELCRLRTPDQTRPNRDPTAVNKLESN